MSFKPCRNQSNCEVHPSSAEEKVNDYIFDDGKKYDGWGCYRNGIFIPHGCGKAKYPECYAYGNFKNGSLNGPAIISYDYYMYTMYFKNDRGNGWGLCINGGNLVEFGYYRDSQLQTDLTEFVRWYYDGVLVKSNRNGEKMMSMYTSKETKEVVNLLIGYAPKKESDGISLVCMGFRFKADGSVWVGNGNLNTMTGDYIHFRPDGCVDVGMFISDVLHKRMSLQEFIDNYFGTHKTDKDSTIANLLKYFPKISTQYKRESDRERYHNIEEPKVDYNYFTDNYDVEEKNTQMYDRDVRIEYMQQLINDISPIKSKVDDAIRIFELGDIPLLQQKLYELVICLNKRGTGRLITSYAEKDKLCEVFHLCLRFDWMYDNDIREVWAENAFYCAVKYWEEIHTNAVNRQDLAVAALDLFLTCIYGESSLYPKFNNILRKAYNHPIHYSYFSEANYTGGAKHLVREFKCFAATILAPIEKTYPQIISSSIRAEFENAKSDSEFLNISSEETLRKMKLMSDIFESILNDV